MNKLFFATSNKGKVDEAREILQQDVEILDVELDEIQSLDLEKVVEHKVIQAYKKIKSPVFVDDVSIEVEIWRNFPGPFIKYLQNLGNDLILYMMRNEENRNVRVIDTIAYHDGKKVHFFTGEVLGKIAKEERGNKGWGFDPIFLPDGESQTFGEMMPSKKNRLSHRRKALDKFKQYLDSQSKLI